MTDAYIWALGMIFFYNDKSQPDVSLYLGDKTTKGDKFPRET